jgi:hypothetical protein
MTISSSLVLSAIGLLLVVLGLVAGANVAIVSLGVTVVLAAGIADAEPVRSV